MIGTDIQNAVLSVTKDWAKIQRQEIRDSNAADRALERMFRASHRVRTIKDLVWENMEKVYAKVSGDGTLPAAARQLMYAMRPIVEAELTDKEFSDQYFTQTLLPDFMQENLELTGGWDVVFDARGHFSEPHTDRSIALGTIAVRDYLRACMSESAELSDIPEIMADNFETCGPTNRFHNVLFIEKEGFMPLFDSVQIAQRFDLAIMSTKGMSSTAARRLMEKLKDVQFFVLHDFDQAGFSIAGTMQRDTRRYQFKRPVDIVDIGLRLADVKAEKLEGERVKVRGDSPEDNLRLNGATEEEIAYLTGNGSGRGKRVELNAMTSPQFINWIERKLKQHDVTKLIPDNTVLETAYRRAWLTLRMNEKIKSEFDALRKEAGTVAVPKELATEVRKKLKQYPEICWDTAVSKIVAKKAEP